MSDERTRLVPLDELQFQSWARENQIADVDDPRSFYDYRGYWKETGGKPIKFGVDHFPDTYKQHGHPTFSVESKYSEGPYDGGRWLSETDYVPPGADLLINSRGQRRSPMIREAILALLKNRPQ